MPRIAFREFNQGLWIAGPHDQNATGTLRRAKGLHSIRANELRSRAGSELLATSPSGNITAITYFAGKIWFGTSTGKLYRVDSTGPTLVKEGFDVTKLRFIQAPPQAGIEDYLFVSGGGDGVGLIKIDKESNVSQWGIEPPIDGFTVEKAPQKEKVVAQTDDNTLWLKAREFGFNGPDPAQQSSIKDTAWMIPIDPSSLSSYQIKFNTPVNLKTFDATTLDPFTGSSDLDYIQFKLYVDNPEQLDFVQIGFDLVAGGLFFTDFYTALIVVREPITTGSPEQFADVQPLTELLQERRRALALDKGGTVYPRVRRGSDPDPDFATVNRVVVRSTAGEAEILPLFGTLDVRLETDTWSTVTIPKSRLHRSGDNEELDLSAVHAMRIYFRTKERNAQTGEKITQRTIVHVDDIKLVGGYGTKGLSYLHKVTYRDSRTGSRSNANPTFVETKEVDRHGFILRNLPITNVPDGADQLEIWRTYGDQADLFLAKRIEISELLTDRTETEALAVGEAADFASDYAEMNKRDPVAGVGTVENTNPDDTHVLFSSSTQGLFVRPGDVLVIDELRYRVISKPSGTVAKLDRAVDVNTPTEFEWLAADLELAQADLSSLPIDNTRPNDTFDDVVWFEARAWWIDNLPGQRGILHFSGIGRPESYVDNRPLASDREQLVRLIAWNGSLWAFSQERIYQVEAQDDPVLLRQIDSAPGTVRAYTVVATPVGIIYQAADGIRVFDGTSSQLISLPLDPVFTGQTSDGIAPFIGTDATSNDGEYFVTNGTTTLAIDGTTPNWREVGLALDSLQYIDTTEQLLAGRGGDLLSLEVEGEVLDGEEPIPFAVETPGVRSPSGRLGIVRRLFIDANTHGENITPTLILDTGEIQLPPFRVGTPDSEVRQTVEYAQLVNANIVGVRLEGTLNEPVRIFGIELDVYLPGEGA